MPLLEMINYSTTVQVIKTAKGLGCYITFFS